MKVQELEDFLEVHGALLASAGLPPSLHEKLFDKLSADVFDGGNFFEIEPVESGRQRRLVFSSQRLPKLGDVFLIDHAWSFRLTQARSQLEQIPGLVERMAALMCVADDVEEIDNVELEGTSDIESVILHIAAETEGRGEKTYWLELDDGNVTDEVLHKLNLSAKFPDLIGLSMWNNPLESVEEVMNTVAGLSKLRALWLNECPVASNKNDELQDALGRMLPHLEIYNRKLTNKYGLWAVGFCAGVFSANHPGHLFAEDQALEDVTSLDLSERDMQTFSPHVFNPEKLPNLTSLNLRGNPFANESAESLLATIQTLKSLKSLQVDIPGPLGNASSIAEALPFVLELNGRSRDKFLGEENNDTMSNLEPRLPMFSKEEPLIERVMSAMWQYINTYRLADEEKLDETPIWYVMDELGSALRHSDVPNFQVAPFMYLPDGTIQSAISYSLLWPVQDVSSGDECTRDYLFGIGEDRQRSSRLAAWFHIPSEVFPQAYDSHMSALKQPIVREPIAYNDPPTSSIFPQDGAFLSVFSDIPGISDFLTHPKFKLVEEPKEADIVWTHMQIDDEFRKAAGLQPQQYVNQFPSEECIVMKHNLAETMQKAYGTPSWLQPTYNMDLQLAALFGDFLQREENKQNNLWIVKPWNMARTIDTSIVGSLPALARLVETGPKIGQKYIEQPALYKGRKFDLRYIVLLRSLQPLEIFVCDVFWGRFSNNQYTLETNSLAEYETHFTVMNYGRTMNHLDTHSWVPEFEKEHNVKWQDIHRRVREVLRAVFEGAAAVHPEMKSPTSRAIYGVDIMLDASFQPKLLEVTYCPDCGRAAKYDVRNVLGDGELMKGSEFYNNVFSCLFLNELKNISPL
nr:tubulin--tyrosine ligase-like protein 12 [Physcomitrium patens]|eukprot:XP_024379358.1 tubulin--tyrosine ligase-like protein 12 [Physcomitrella patens]